MGPGQGFGIMSGIGGGMGNLPLQQGAPGALQYRMPPGCQNPLSSPGGYRAAPVDPTEALLAGTDSGSQKLFDWTVADLERFVRNSIFWNQPSPLQAPPYRGYYKDLIELIVIGPPTAGASAGATAGAQALADGANTTQDPNDPVLVVTPSIGGEYVNVLTFTTPSNQAYMIYSVEAWGHDWLGCLNAVKWRILVGDNVVFEPRELGVLGEQVRVQSLVKPGTTITVQATTWDTSSGTLVNFRMQGWIFPLPNTDDDMWALVRTAESGRAVATVQASMQGGASSYGSPDPYSSVWIPAPVGELRGAPVQYNPATGQFLPSRSPPWQFNQATGEVR